MYTKNEILSKIEEIITPIIDNYEMELVDLKWSQKSGNWVLCIYIDKEEGITLNDCEVVNHEISDLLDRKDIISHHYVLEISSPGLERPLKKKNDFDRFTGHNIKISTHEPLQGQKNFKGRLRGIDTEDNILLQFNDSGNEVQIPLRKIAKANLIFKPEFGKNSKGGKK